MDTVEQCLVLRLSGAMGASQVTFFSSALDKVATADTRPGGSWDVVREIPVLELEGVEGDTPNLLLIPRATCLSRVGWESQEASLRSHVNFAWPQLTPLVEAGLPFGAI